MIIIGITGSIGMGKTTIAQMLRRFSIPIFDSDNEVKNILENDDNVKSQIIEIWPNVKIREDNRTKIDKTLLSKIIFSKKTNRKKLERIIHPLVKMKRDVFIKNNYNSFIMALDIPLLYETGTDKICDEVFLTYTNQIKQRERVLARANMSEDVFNFINKVQWDTEKKKMKKPYLVTTTYGKLISFILVTIYLIIIIIKKKVIKL